MDSFFELFFAMGCSSMFFDNWSPDFDIVGSLPLEVAVIILRKLDGKSLLNAAQVSFKWLQIIKFDRVLRKTVRDELARQRHEKLKRHMFLSDSASSAIHEAAFHPTAKKVKRDFKKSVKLIQKPMKIKSNVPSASTAQLRKLR